MAVEVGYGWQSPRVSFGNMENGWQSPTRISFSVDLSYNDKLSPDLRKNINDNINVITEPSEFEFSMIPAAQSCPPKTQIILSADQLFGNGKILPRLSPPLFEKNPTHDVPEPISNPFEQVQEELKPSPAISIARHLSLESSSLRSTSYPGSSKNQKKWKEMFKIPTKDSNPEPNLSRVQSQKSVWRFTRSCSSGSEARFNNGGLLCSLPFPRSYSAKHRQNGLESFSTSSNLLFNESSSSSSSATENAVQKPASSSKAMKMKSRNRSGDQRRPTMASPRPGKPISDHGYGYQRKNSKSRSGSYGASVGINPVLNVPVCVRNNNGSVGLFSFFSSKSEKHSHKKNNER